jgi:hypothetical protein
MTKGSSEKIVQFLIANSMIFFWINILSFYYFIFQSITKGIEFVYSETLHLWYWQPIDDKNVKNHFRVYLKI